MNHVDCVTKRDDYPQKTHPCSKNIRGISLFFLKISMVYQEKYILGVIARVFRKLKDKIRSGTFYYKIVIHVVLNFIFLTGTYTWTNFTIADCHLHNNFHILKTVWFIQCILTRDLFTFSSYCYLLLQENFLTIFSLIAIERIKYRSTGSQ